MKNPFNIKQLALTLFCLGTAVCAQAQTDSSSTDTAKLFAITTYQGGEFVGRIISQDAKEILIETKDRGLVTIPRYLVKEIKELDGVQTKSGSYTPSEVFSTRYFLSTNGLPIKKGESYIQWNYWGPDFELGIAKNLSVGVMTSWILYPVVATTKYSIPLGKKTSLGIGALAGTSTWFPEESQFRFALPFGCFTYGDRKNSINFSGGYGSFWLNRKKYGDAMFSLAGMTKLGKKASFVFDSFMLPGHTKDKNGSTVIIIPGVRIQTSSRKAFQVGLVMVASQGGYLPFPIPLLQWFKKI